MNNEFKLLKIIFALSGLIFAIPVFAIDVKDCPPASMLKQLPLNIARYIPSFYLVSSNVDVQYKDKSFFIMMSPIYFASTEEEALRIGRDFIKTISEPEVGRGGYCYYRASELPDYLFIPHVRLVQH